MDPTMLMGFIGAAKGGGGTKVSQSVSNSSTSVISANISGVSSNPMTGAPQTSTTAQSTATASGAEDTGGSWFPDISPSFGGNSYSPADVATASGVDNGQTLMMGLAAAALAGVAWFLFGRK